MNKSLFLYTLFSSLGDFIIMGDLINKVESTIKGSQCLVAHRKNPHVINWKYQNPDNHFFNIYDFTETLNLIKLLKAKRREGYAIFGIQQAPGSIQGFSFFSFLKSIRAIDFIVDFNLYNADIITPPRGNYILDIHLNQIADLLKISIQLDQDRLQLPFTFENQKREKSSTMHKRIGIHPWSSRGHLSCLVWPWRNWMQLMTRILETHKDIEIVIFGKDKRFDEFKIKFQKIAVQDMSRVKFEPSSSIQELTSTISSLDYLLSVNTSVVHIGYALNKKMLILVGPSLNFWIPKGENIKIVTDPLANFPGSDKFINDGRFPSIARIDFNQVWESTVDLLK